MFMRKLLFALMVSTVTAATSVAHAQIVSIEHPVEMRTDCLILPSEATGTLTCGTRSFHLTANTTYFVGEQAYTFAEFGKFVKGLIGRPRNGAVLLTLDLREVRRVYIAAE